VAREPTEPNINGLIVFMRNRYIISALFLLLAGCQVDPIPSDITQLHDQARHDYLVVQPLVQPGDIVFRLGDTKLLGGVMNFSEIIADLTESDFSHACIVLDGNDFLIVDVTPFGIERRYFKDWHITGSKNIVVKRLKPEYMHMVPKVLASVNELIEEDVLYDRDFHYNDDKYYCTELVDYVFRKNGYPLADTIKIKDFPRFNWVYGLMCRLGGIDPNEEAVVAGNDEIGLFSSKMLYTVIDLRDGVQTPIPKNVQLASGSRSPSQIASERPGPNPANAGSPAQ